MGYSKANKASNHEKIVKIAAEKFRQAGFEGIGVADLMKEAGLTHGGFYGHFKSRSQLVTEALEQAADESYAGMQAMANRDGKPSFEAYIERYLSPTHRDTVAHGCCTAALAGEISRCDLETREAYTVKFRRSLAFLVDLLPNLEPEEAKRKALATMATLAGTLALARAVSDEELSQELLTAGIESLKELTRQ